MRARAAREALAAWAAKLGLPFLGVLREAQAYVRSVEQGLTVFDLPRSQAAAHVAEWQPIVDWLEPVLKALHRPDLRANPTVLRAAPVVAPAAASGTRSATGLRGAAGGGLRLAAARRGAATRLVSARA